MLFLRSSRESRTKMAEISPSTSLCCSRNDRMLSPSYSVTAGRDLSSSFCPCSRCSNPDTHRMTFRKYEPFTEKINVFTDGIAIISSFHLYPDLPILRNLA